MKSGSLNLLETSGPLQTCTETALPSHFTLLKYRGAKWSKCMRVKYTHLKHQVAGSLLKINTYKKILTSLPNNLDHPEI